MPRRRSCATYWRIAIRDSYLVRITSLPVPLSFNQSRSSSCLTQSAPSSIAMPFSWVDAVVFPLGLIGNAGVVMEECGNGNDLPVGAHPRRKIRGHFEHRGHMMRPDAVAEWIA